MNIREAIKKGTLILEREHIPSARLDAELLLAETLRLSRLDLIKEPDLTLDEAKVSLFEQYLARRCLHEPMAYLLGRKEFWSLPFRVTPAVLIPRPETELLVEETISVVPPKEKVTLLEIGTGSGAVAVALAKELPQAHLVATDISPEALALAKENAELSGVEKQISFFEGDLYSTVKGKFFAIVSNPPYIRERDYENLPPGVRDFEPPLALRGGEDGLKVIRNLVAQAPAFLLDGGYLILEMGADEKEEVQILMEEAGFTDLFFRRDYAGLWRVARGKRGGYG